MKISACLLFFLMVVVMASNAFMQPRPPIVVRKPISRVSAEAPAEGAEEDGETEAPAKEETSAGPAATDILNSPAFLMKKIDVLKQDITKAEDDLVEATKRYEEAKAEWGPDLDKLQKEFSNMRERISKRSSEGKSEATFAVAKELMRVLDNFDRAFGFVNAQTDEEVEIEATYKQAYDLLVSTLKELGVTQVETVGCEFSYEDHQAMMQQPSDEYEEGTVMAEMAKGWKFGDRLIRPALVTVSAG
eukprot:CAMPEP_0118698412 /NCGR_PEP_ID=MMETSP0800-20121206/15180_1 /TAXON_ID=210618 ORGANISM="Striatella unipunctata, Strain CCMP2910" /NCGR_SAMPLE_ID=MMETSP0800 /ASSEMBLY_ACC=CAM_ASM_000638 /LENGTH=245 /DNA_ID=CAMNT_0006598217 /DNA_START=35 /DNA_END=772 /DNA_ORIENTATION=-